MQNKILCILVYVYLLFSELAFAIKNGGNISEEKVLSTKWEEMYDSSFEKKVSFQDRSVKVSIFFPLIKVGGVCKGIVERYFYSKDVQVIRPESYVFRSVELYGSFLSGEGRCSKSDYFLLQDNVSARYLDLAKNELFSFFSEKSNLKKCSILSGGAGALKVSQVSLGSMRELNFDNENIFFEIYNKGGTGKSFCQIEFVEKNNQLNVFRVNEFIE